MHKIGHFPLMHGLIHIVHGFPLKILRKPQVLKRTIVLWIFTNYGFVTK